MIEAFLPMRSRIAELTSLSEEEWLLMEPYLTLRTISKGDFLIKEGSQGRELGFIISGQMRHYYTKNGDERTTYFYFENHFTGPYLSCISGKPSALSIQALADTNLIVFPYSALVHLFQTSHRWERFGRLLAEYLATGLEERMAGLLMQNPEERYLELLQGNKRKIIERIPQHFIANYLGITPESLSRIRKRLSEN